ncbi:potassium-transporting ATPase KdpC subunit [Sphaerisporangium melleum]|uniref:Potassium-transporting ATPase KdpC subunit n=1 Tax=Sphaerisporangium melleum TaxID=321316 RepID=A0A917RL38_9ACTN|nr:potassium-transporting ATPase subunit C [Sphaerisporangium melleum]GGL13537.1 potassium-transporting ATPase KdpC subunit [Sphaerisporangium melleum]GII74513.1 potassium-transporting ATPase KdpC subunit [Sphaerisporangium melleum]
MERLPSWIRRHLAALRALLVLTLVTGAVYPLLVTGVAQAVFHDSANGSIVRQNGKDVGSALIGQKFTGPDGAPLRKYFQSRPSAAGDGYDPTATAASNLGPEDIVDTLPAPGAEGGRRSLLTQVCARSRAAGELEGVSGTRPFCTPDGVGAVLKVFPAAGTPTRVVSVNQACPAAPFAAEYQGVRVECARPGEDYAAGRTVPVRGTARAVVPADAVTASGSGLDPHISPAYAALQAPRVAKARGLDLGTVTKLIAQHTIGRALGFMGDPAVNVLRLNLALDHLHG